MKLNEFAKRFSLHLDFSDLSVNLNCELPEFGIKGSVNSNFNDLLALRLQNVVLKVIQSLDVYVPLKSQFLFGADEVVKNFDLDLALQAKLGDLPNSLDASVSLTYQKVLQFFVGSLRNPIQTSGVGVNCFLPLNVFLPEKRQDLFIKFGLAVPLIDPLHSSSTVSEIFKMVPVNRGQTKALPIASIIVPINSEKNITIDLLMNELIPNFPKTSLQSVSAHIDFSDISNLSLSGDLQVEGFSARGSLPIGAFYSLSSELLNYEKFFTDSMKIVEAVKPLNESFVKDVKEAFLQIINCAETNQRQLGEAKLSDLNQKLKKEAKILFDTMVLHSHNYRAINQLVLIQQISELYQNVFSVFVSKQQKLELDRESEAQLTFAQKKVKEFGELAKVCADIIEHKEMYLWDPVVLVYLEKIFGIKFQGDLLFLPDDYVLCLENQK